MPVIVSKDGSQQQLSSSRLVLFVTCKLSEFLRLRGALCSPLLLLTLLLRTSKPIHAPERTARSSRFGEGEREDVQVVIFTANGKSLRELAPKLVHEFNLHLDRCRVAIVGMEEVCPHASLFVACVHAS